MLSKNNKILIGCLALLLVMSVGYALFSDTITINGTATAKGEFDITATCETGVSSVLGTAESLGYLEGGYKNDSCSVIDDNVSFTTEFLYPGARRNFTVKLTNTGTIDASLSMGESTTSRQICVADNSEGENQECDIDGDVKDYKANIYAMLANNGKGYAMEDSEGNLLVEGELSEFLNMQTYTITLKPGYSLYLGFSSSVDHVNDSYTTNEMFVSYTSTMTLPFKQVQ